MTDLQDIVESIDGGYYKLVFTGSLKYNDYREWFAQWFNNLPLAGKLEQIIPLSQQDAIVWQIDTKKSAAEYMTETGGVLVLAEVNIVLEAKGWEDVPFLNEKHKF